MNTARKCGICKITGHNRKTCPYKKYEGAVFPKAHEPGFKDKFYGIWDSLVFQKYIMLCTIEGRFKKEEAEIPPKLQRDLDEKRRQVLEVFGNDHPFLKTVEGIYIYKFAEIDGYIDMCEKKYNSYKNK